jgi:hypothetical protein
MERNDPEGAAGAWIVFVDSADLVAFAVEFCADADLTASFSLDAASLAPQLSQKLFKGEFFVPHFEQSFVSAIDQLLLRKGFG